MEDPHPYPYPYPHRHRRYGCSSTAASCRASRGHKVCWYRSGQENVFYTRRTHSGAASHRRGAGEVGEGESCFLGDNAFSGGAGENTLAGENVFSGSAGENTLAGENVFSGSAGENTLAGENTFSHGASENTFVGENVFSGGAGENVLRADGTEQVLGGESGKDSAPGGAVWQTEEGDKVVLSVETEDSTAPTGREGRGTTPPGDRGDDSCHCTHTPGSQHPEAEDSSRENTADQDDTQHSPQREEDVWRLKGEVTLTERFPISETEDWSEDASKADQSLKEFKARHGDSVFKAEHGDPVFEAEHCDPMLKAEQFQKPTAGAGIPSAPRGDHCQPTPTPHCPRTPPPPPHLQHRATGELPHYTCRHSDDCNTAFPSHPRQSAATAGTTTTTTTTTTVNQKDAAIIQRLISFIQAKHKEEVKDEEVYREWHDVACVLDRLLFYVFLIITVVSSVAILEMRPGDVQF